MGVLLYPTPPKGPRFRLLAPPRPPRPAPVPSRAWSSLSNLPPPTCDVHETQGLHALRLRHRHRTIERRNYPSDGVLRRRGVGFIVHVARTRVCPGPRRAPGNPRVYGSSTLMIENKHSGGASRFPKMMRRDRRSALLKQGHKGFLNSQLCIVVVVCCVLSFWANDWLNPP
ncbi:hypothetical protein BJV78DRAFT_936453 [Lactifluus subvellereus]|nr:hypothetical protein BJV78DRAFT_936453 [Lactifluus subvellereus]